MVCPGPPAVLQPVHVSDINHFCGVVIMHLSDLIAFSQQRPHGQCSAPASAGDKRQVCQLAGCHSLIYRRAPIKIGSSHLSLLLGLDD
jgi:hypothetical protein